MSASASFRARALDLVERSVSRPTISEALSTARPGTVTAARAGRRPVALVVLASGRAYAVPDACPHDGGPLSDGFLDGDTLVCSRHGWEFEVCTGRCPAHPRHRLDARQL